MSQEQERIAFEAWAKKEGFSIERGSKGFYTSLGTNQLFSGWLGRASPPEGGGIAHLYEALEPALEELVNCCNHGEAAVWEEVIAAEAALERLYKARVSRLRYTSPPAAASEAVAWECVIEEADFEADTITVKMKAPGYWVSAGTYVLSPPAPLSGASHV